MQVPLQIDVTEGSQAYANSYRMQSMNDKFEKNA